MENIKKGLEKLNTQPITDENADIYKDLSESLYRFKLIEAMDKGSDYNYSGTDIRYSGDGRIGMDGDNDGRYHESRTRMMPRYFYSGVAGKDHMMQDLRAMAADADSEKKRRRINEFIADMEEMSH